MSTRRPAQVVVLAKSPVPGRVKTRLTPPFSPTEAAELAAAALDDTLRAVLAARLVRHVLVLAGPRPVGLPSGLDLRIQRGAGLDERIEHALIVAHAELPVPVLLVGMDTPQLSPAEIETAADSLLAPEVDAVLGLSRDGGFWSLGLRDPEPGDVVGVPMSRPDTGARQLNRLVGRGRRVRLLPTYDDVDDARDAVAVAASAPGTSFAAALRRMTAAGEDVA